MNAQAQELVVVVEQPLTNEYGSSYGTRYLVFATKAQDAVDWITANLDGEDGKPYYEGRDVWNQVQVEIISAYDEAGNLDRSPFWDLLALFANKDIGPSVLKRIARLMP